MFPLLAVAGISAATSLLSSSAAGRAQAAQAGAIGRWEGEQITRERQQKTLQNAYATAAANAMLGLEKQKMARTLADISTGGAVASATATVQNASTGTIGASAQAVQADIQQKVDSAQAQVQDAFEQTLENHNAALQEMVLNTAATETQPRKIEYQGPSTGQMLGGALLAGVSSFASSYFMQSAKLGLGTPKTSLTGPGLSLPSSGNSGLGLRF